MKDITTITMVISATFFTASAQLLFKLGTNSGSLIEGLPLNIMIVGGFISYAIAALLFVQALNKGDLSVLYPIWSLSFVWIFAISSLLLNETVSITNWAGAGLIVTGVSFIGKGAKNA